MKNPNVKERRFLKAYLEGKSLAECARYAGSKGKDNHSLTVIGCQMLAKLSLSMEETLTLCGLTDDVLARKIREGLEADRATYASFRGKFLDERRDPDYSARAKYAEMLARLKGLFIDRHELTGREGGDIVLQIAPASGNKGKKTLQID